MVGIATSPRVVSYLYDHIPILYSNKKRGDQFPILDLGGYLRTRVKMGLVGAISGCSPVAGHFGHNFRNDCDNSA